MKQNNTFTTTFLPKDLKSELKIVQNNQKMYKKFMDSKLSN